MSKKKYVYLFSEGNAQMRELLGGQGRKSGRDDRLGSACSSGIYRDYRSLHSVL